MSYLGRFVRASVFAGLGLMAAAGCENTRCGVKKNYFITNSPSYSKDDMMCHFTKDTGFRLAYVNVGVHKTELVFAGVSPEAAAEATKLAMRMNATSELAKGNKVPYRVQRCNDFVKEYMSCNEPDVSPEDVKPEDVKPEAEFESYPTLSPEAK